MVLGILLKFFFWFNFFIYKCGVNITILLLFVDVQVRLCIRNIFLKYVIIYACYFLSLYPILILVVFAQKKRQYWDGNLFHWRESISFGIKEPLEWIMAHQLINACNIPSGFSNFLILEILERIKPGNAFFKNIVYFLGKTAKKYSAFNM